MHITRLDESGIDDAAALLVRAFFDYPVWTWMLPDEARRREIMPWFMRMSLRYGVRGGETYTAGDPVTGVAMWEPPDRLDADLEADTGRDENNGWDQLPEVMGGDAMTRLNAMIETQRPVRDRVSNGKPVWYLPWLGVDPDAQRSGIGGALLREMFARTDAQAVPCLLETEKQGNVPYYERHGFAVAESGQLPLDGPRFWTMLRRSGSAARA